MAAKRLSTKADKGKSKGGIVSGNIPRMHFNGKPVRDAKKPLILEVTTDDIEHSNPLDKAGCAAAVAVMRQEGVSNAYIHLSKAYIERGDYYERYEIPGSLRSEIIAYDRKGSFEPDEFKLRAPPPSSRLGSKRKAKTQYRLQVPGGNNALPTKSTWKTYKSKGTPGTRPRRHVVAKVRSRPSGFNK
jgi:hypothetical protein